MENIVIRTMKGDLEKIKNPQGPAIAKITEIKKDEPQKSAWSSVSHEAPIPASKFSPSPSPKPESKPLPQPVTAPSKPPVLIVPPQIVSPKTIPPKNIPELPLKPLYKTTPTWIKLGFIGLAVIAASLSGLFGYWKYFIRDKTPIVLPPTATTTAPTLPAAPVATTTAPIKFFNKLPNKSITIDLPTKTASALTKALKSEAKIEETRASVKQIKITYKGNPLTIEEFFELMSISTPKDFLLNYETEFAFAFFNHNYLKQEEGVRPILILKAKDKNFAMAQMESWEKTTLTQDVYLLFLKTFSIPKNIFFKSYSFISQPVRYLNMSIPYTSLNYSIYNNFLIFSTSSAGMYTILQDLLEQNVSFDYIKSLEASIKEFVK